MPEFSLTGQINLRPPTDLDNIKRAIQNKLGNVTVVPLNQIPVATNQLKKFNYELGKVALLSNDVEESFFNIGRNLGQTVRRFGAFTIATTALFGVIRSFQANIKEAVLFEKELIKISQVTGTSMKGLSDLKDEITDLSISLGVGSTKLLSVARVLAQAGLAADDVKITMAAIAKSDLSPTFDSMEQTTEGVVAAMRQFRIESGRVESVLGSINAVAGKFAVESADLIQFIRGAGGTFEAAGGTIEELFGLGTSIRATTRESAASIATGLRTIFARLQRTRTQNFLEDFNIQLRLTREEANKLGKTEGEFVGPFEAIKRLSIALQQIPSTDPRFAQIIEELGGFRQINKVIPLIKQNALAQQAYNVALQGTNSINKDAEKALESLANKIDRVAEKFIEISRVILENDEIKVIIDQVIELSNVVLDSVKALSSLSSAIGLLPLSAFAGAVPLVAGFRGVKRNKGGSIPGSGNTDTVPAMLTPGEFVLRKQAVAGIGLANLIKMNATGKIPGFNAGGIVGKFVGPDTVTQMQVGGMAYVLGSAIGKLSDEFSVLSKNVQLAAATFVILSLGSGLFKKDFSAATKSLEDNISVFSSNLEKLKGDKESAVRISVTDAFGKSHSLVSGVSNMTTPDSKVFTEVNTEAHKILEGKALEAKYQAEATQLKKESVEWARKERDSLQKITAYRDEQGRIFKGADVEQLKGKVEQELKESFFGTDIIGLLQNKSTRSGINSILNNTADFQNILSSNKNEPGGTSVFENFLKSEVRPDFDFSKLLNSTTMGLTPDLAKFLDVNSVTARNDSKWNKLINPKFAERFYAATGFKDTREPISVRDIIQKFASGEISGRQVEKTFAGGEFAGMIRELFRSKGVDESRKYFARALSMEGGASGRDILSKFASGESGKKTIDDLSVLEGGKDIAKAFREFIKQQGTAKARVLIDRSLKADQNVSLTDLVDSMAKGTIGEQNIPSEIRDVFRQLQNYPREIQEKIVKLMAKYQELDKMESGSVVVNEAGKVVSKTEQKEILDAEMLSAAKEANNYMTKDQKLAIEKNKRREATLRYISTQEGSEKTLAKISKKREDIETRILNRSNELQSLIASTSGKPRDIQTEAKIDELTSQNKEDFAEVGKLKKKEQYVKDAFARQVSIEANSVENQIKNQERLIMEEQNKIVAMQKAERAMNYLSMGINIASSGLIAFGSFLEKDASDRMESFKKGLGDSENLARDTAIAKSTSALGVGLVGGSVFGSQIGTALGGPMGGLIGMAIGAAASGITYAGYTFIGTMNEIDEQIKSVVRNKSLDKFEQALIKAGQNTSLALSENSSIRSGSSSALNDVLTLQGDSAREDLFGRLENMRNPLQEFVNRVAGSVSSLQDFNKVVGQDTVRLFLILNQIPLSKFNEEISKNIAISNKAREINTNLIKTNQDLLLRMTIQRNIVSVVSDSVYNLDKNLSSLNGTVSLIDGNFKSNLAMSGIEKLGKINTVSDFSAFQSDVDKVGNIFGSAGQLISNNAVRAAQAIQVLPDILLDINSRSNLEGTGEFTQKMEKELERLGVGEEIRKILVAQVDDIIGPEAKDQNIISKLNTDFEGTIAQITKGLANISDPLREAGSMFQTKFNQIGDLLDQRITIEEKLSGSFIKTLDVYEQSERILANAFGKDLDFNKLLDLDRMRQASILPIPSLQNNPQGIFDRLQSAQESLRSAQDMLQNSTNLTAEEMLSLREQISNNKMEVTSLTNALEFMSDVTKRVSILQEALSKEQKDRQTKFGFAETMAFGSQQEIRQLLSSIQLTNMAIKAGSVENFTADQKKQIQDLLNRVGDTALFANGMTGNKAKELLVGNNIKRLGGDARGIAFAGEAEKDLQKKILDATLKAQEAQNLLYNNLKIQNDLFNTKLGQTLNQFITDLSNTFKTTTIASLEANIKRKEFERDREKQKVDAVASIQDTFGMDINALRPIISTLQAFEKQKASLSNLKNVPKFFGTKMFDGISGKFEGVDTEKIMQSLAGLGISTTKVKTRSVGGVDMFSDLVDTKQSKLLINSIEKNLSASIKDENIVAEIMSNISKNILPSSIEEIMVGGVKQGDFIVPEKLFSGIDKAIMNSLQNLEGDMLASKVNRDEAVASLNKDPKKAEKLSADLLDSASNIEKLFKTLGETFNFDQTQVQIRMLNEEIKILGENIRTVNEGRNPRGFSSGGLVGGNGNRDSVSARLTPGEFVLNRKTVERIGISNLNRLNKSNSKTPVTNSTTSVSNTNNSMEIAQESLSQLNRAMQTFAFNVQKLEKAFSSFPTEINITGRHFVEVVINGAQVLQSIKPEIAQLIESEIKVSINKMLKVKFPDKGQII